ncbi:MAG: biopolymer transporter ExbD [Kiritimatiellae bacterium]|nr:biopolymer transporter ExbD [Kiritimatiellia bacterium]MDW8458781.1 biopolymer transporter ExbD [Verrucomicrobiota bacterium]
MARRKQEDTSINMTPMIDVVFQLIIFFVVTTDMQQKAIDESIRLAMAPHAKPVETRDPREIVIEVDKNGRISIARVYMSADYLYTVIRKVVADHGQTVPVIIRADGETRHDAIRAAMDAVTRAGLWKVKFAAIREKAS